MTSASQFRLAMGFALVLMPLTAIADETRWTRMEVAVGEALVCSAPACQPEAVVIVGKAGTRRYPVPTSLLNDPDFVALLARGIAATFADSVAQPAFERRRIGQHDGVFGPLAPVNGAPVLAYVSFNHAEAREFIATSATTEAAFEALAEVVSLTPVP